MGFTCPLGGFQVAPIGGNHATFSSLFSYPLSLSLLSPLSLSFLLRLSVDGHFPLSISKFQVEKDHSFLLQTELETLIR